MRGRRKGKTGSKTRLYKQLGSTIKPVVYKSKTGKTPSKQHGHGISRNSLRIIITALLFSFLSLYTMKTFADKIIHFNKTISFTGTLPPGIRIMNPFKEDTKVNSLSAAFYKKYYEDRDQRHIVLGINPGRFGGGITGIPFTDPKRLIEKCGIPFHGELKHEPSSVFIYEMIYAFGGAEAFYKKFYINSVCPLGFTALNSKGREVNYNYYDSKELTAAVYDFMNWSICTQITFGINTDTAFCFGTGKNEKFLRELNEEKKYFKKIIALEHPRFIMQYKSMSKAFYIDKYLSGFHSVG
jgi:hypothetical protein